MKLSSKFLLSLALALSVLSHPTANAAPVEDWKGKAYDKNFQASVMSGMTIMGTAVGFGLMASFAGKILDKGFIPDISNQVFLEGTLGPTFMSAGTGWQMGAHLRWDFHKNEFWTFYSLGGFGWDIIPNGFTNLVAFHPRFGGGVLWDLFPQISLRGEISHEFIGVGAAFMF
jgi:hypothetical protein